jgi:hypothetical protein
MVARGLGKFQCGARNRRCLKVWPLEAPLVEMILNLTDAGAMLEQFRSMDGFKVTLTERAAVLELEALDRELMLWVFSFGLVDVSMGVAGPDGPVVTRHKYVNDLADAEGWVREAVAQYAGL